MSTSYTVNRKAVLDSPTVDRAAVVYSIRYRDVLKALGYSDSHQLGRGRSLSADQLHDSYMWLPTVTG